MITIIQLLAMPIGEKIGGGFIQTVKMTKKSVQLPDTTYAHTVVLFDKTGEIIADFITEKYSPMIKGEQVKIIVAEIQSLILKSGETGTKLYVSQFEKLTQTLSEYEEQMVDYVEDWTKQIEGKIRHGLVCSFIRAGKEINKPEIEALVKYIMNGEQK